MSLEIIEEIAAELYFRAQAAQSKEERAAIKGVQHSIERVLERHKVEKKELSKARAQNADWPWFSELQAYSIKMGSRTHTKEAEARATKFVSGLRGKRNQGER